MGILTYLTDVQIKDSKTEIDGKVLTKPTLLVSDGSNSTYACNVDVGITTMSGYDQAEDLENEAYTGTILYNVPIARNNNQLIYADVGCAVRLRRSSSGKFEIVGFSGEMPGTNIRIGIDLQDYPFGQIEDTDIQNYVVENHTYLVRLLTFGELAEYGVFGVIPLGTTASFYGDQFLRLN